MAVEQIDAALITIERRGFGAIDQKTDLCAVGIVRFGREEHLLVFCERIVTRRVTEKAVIAPCPQQGVERLDTLPRPRLHHGAPAALKAFLEQVLRPDFAFDYKASDKAEARLKGRSARIVVTMGMPAVAYRWWFFAHSLKSLERNILKFTGMGPVRHTLLGGVAAADEAKRRSWFDAMAALGRQAR